MASSIITEEDNYIGIDIRQQLPNDGDYVKMKIKPSDAGVVKEFAYGKVSKIAKGSVGQVIVDEDEYDLEFELCIRQYFMENRTVLYDKWKFKQHIILGDIINWRAITFDEYQMIDDAFENMGNDTSIQPQPEPILQNPITDVPIQGGRKSRRNRRKSRRNRRKSRRSRR
jgi:hypothetical protein